MVCPGGQGKEKTEAFALDPDIARKAAQSQFGEPRPGQTESDENQAEQDQQSRHDDEWWAAQLRF
jgi:hypothetical protein